MTPTTKQTTAILADPHTLVRQLLREFLERHGIRLLGEAGDGRGAIRLARRRPGPALALIEATLPRISGVAATQQIVRAGPRVIVLAASVSREQVNLLLQAGASAYLTKWCTPEQLLRAIRAATAGRQYLCPAAEAALSSRKPRGRAAGGQGLVEMLTPREREVLQLLAEGLAGKQIAGLLERSVKTVDAHRQNIGRKLGTSNLAKLTRMAIREGISPLLLNGEALAATQRERPQS